MAPPTAPIAYAPESREFLWGIESVAAGTPATIITHEVAEDCTIRQMRSKYQTVGFRKAAATRGKSYVTQRYVEIDMKLAYHSAGLGAFTLACLQGNTSEGAVTGTTVKTHPFTPNPVTNRMNTMTLWLDYGDHNHVQVFTFATVSGWSATINPDGALELSITFIARWPTYTSSVTATNYCGSTAGYPLTPVLGDQGTYTLYNSVGTAYINNILGCTLSLARNVKPLPNAQSADPSDINANELMFSGSIDFEYDGLAAHSIHDDYMQYANLGSAGTTHAIVFTNADGHGFELDFYYMRWEDPTFNFAGEVITVSTPFSTEHDETVLDASSPSLTALKTVKILNALTAVMTT